MKQIVKRSQRLVMILSFFFMAIQSGKCRPNWPDYTDGKDVYAFEDWSPHEQFTLVANNDKIYIKLKRINTNVYELEPLSDNYFHLPVGSTAGDMVYRTEFSFFFISKKTGKTYLSLNMVRSYSREAIQEQILEDSLSIIEGNYVNKSGKEFSFHPQKKELFYNEHTEPFIFEPDVVSNGKTLIHIKTNKRRWLLDLTPEGMDIYNAVKPNGSKKYVKGKLVMTAKYQGNMEYNIEKGRFPFTARNAPLPLVSIINKYLTPELKTLMWKELYARHGAIFPDKKTSDFFKKWYWYKPTKPLDKVKPDDEILAKVIKCL